MEWRVLEDHFRVATTQDPGPFGERAVEWDYSRYARGVGLMGEPGACDLPHRGCSILALPPARWDAAEKRYRAWAEPRGWSFWRVSARPTVAVPDPVVHALAELVAGSASLPLGKGLLPYRSGRGRRCRGETMSLALTPAERWLIGTDRLRRRMRAEIALCGIVLLVEEAEKLTPAALGVLMHLLDAHRAWRARMLSRPARIYVVFATAPHHEGDVVRMLERFRLNGHAPIARDRPRADAAGTGNGSPVQPSATLPDVEDEHLFSALAAAPLALAEQDVRALFGASAVTRARDMVERGVLRRRLEAGKACYLPHPAYLAAGVPVAPRVLHAICDLYFRRARHGHAHLRPAAAALAFRLGEPSRACAAVARTPHAAGAMLTPETVAALESGLERLRSRLRARHLAVWFSLRAHQCEYARARELAGALAEREIDTWRDLRAAVVQVLCTGRIHLDACLPLDFWPKLRSRRLAGPFLDATCVLAELFWRKRYLGTSDLRQRYEFACECFAKIRAEPRPRGASYALLEAIVRLVAYRAALELEIPSGMLSSSGNPADPPERHALRSFLHLHRIPAYVAATSVNAETITNTRAGYLSYGDAGRYLGYRLGAATGNPADMRISVTSFLPLLVRRRQWLLMRDLTDESLLLLRPDRNDIDVRGWMRTLQVAVGSRVWLLSANTFLLDHGRAQKSAGDGLEDSAVADALLFAGDLAGARERLLAGIAHATATPRGLGWLLKSHVALARATLDTDVLDRAEALLGRHGDLLPAEVRAHLAALMRGSRALLRGAPDLAERGFREAEACLSPSGDVFVTLQRYAVASRVSLAFVQGVVRRWAEARAGGPSVWRVLRRLCSRRAHNTSSPSVKGRAALHLEYVWPLLDAWAKRSHPDGEVLRLVFFLKGAVDAAFGPLGRDFVGLMAEWAPRLYERVRTAVLHCVGELGVASTEARALNAALKSVEAVWKDGHRERIEDRCTHVLIREGGSSARNARAASGNWYDDGALFQQLWDERGRVRSSADGHAVVAYGSLAPAPARPAAIVVSLRAERRGTGVFRVSVDATERRPTPGAAKRPAGHRRKAPEFRGGSEAAQRVRTLIEAAAKCSYPTLVTGETGSGKELVARCIHEASAWREQPIVVAACASTVDSLLESELFGHERGAFTGAVERRSGYFERANGSTLLLDEVDNMSARMQAALLRVLETGEYRPLGSASQRKSEFRLISTGQPRLAELIERGQFREDLYYRISTLKIGVPPLRDRDGDAEEIAAAHARGLGFQLTAGAMRAIARYDWPGNVRQLCHCIEAASLRAPDRRIGEAAVAEAIGGHRTISGSSAPREAGAMDRAWARALRALERMGHFGAWDFAQAAGLSRRSAQRHLARLVGDGRILRVGAGRATRYSISRDPLS